MKVLALCGSIRESSSNQLMLKTVQNKMSADWSEFSLKDLPYFDPDLQFGELVPVIVQKFRAQANQADCILISTPEYAHGIPGILKNALEWLICEETMKKKVAIIIGSPSGGAYVKEYLHETLRTMDLIPSEDLTLVITNSRKNPESDSALTEFSFKLSRL